MTTLTAAGTSSSPTDWSPADVRQAVADHFRARGMGPDVVGPDDFTRLVEEGSAGVIRFELSQAARTPRPPVRGWRRR